MEVGTRVTFMVDTARLTDEGPILENVTVTGSVVRDSCEGLPGAGTAPEGHGPVSKSAALTPVMSLTVQRVLPKVSVRPLRIGTALLMTFPAIDPTMLGSVICPTVPSMLFTCGTTAESTSLTVPRMLGIPSGRGTPGAADATLSTMLPS